MTALVVYSMCCRIPGSDGAAYERQLEMTDLWLTHLRERARFAGRVVLLTNARPLPWRDVEAVHLPEAPRDRTALFLHRVLAHDRLRPAPGERWMQLDTDALAMRPIDALFAAEGDSAMTAAPSGLTPLDALHARALMNAPRRFYHGRVRGWLRRPGISACLTSCTAESWPRLMGAWASCIRRHAGKDHPPLGDQSYLNLLYMTGRISARPAPEGAVVHVRRPEMLGTAEAARATVLHSPLGGRLELMRRVAAHPAFLTTAGAA